MKSLYYALFIILFIFNGCQNKQKSKESNQTKIELVKVNNHTISTEVLGKNFDNFFKLDKDKKKKLVEKLIDDEIIVGYAFKIVKSEIEIQNENKRIKEGFKLIKKIALPEVLKDIEDNNLSFKFYNKNKDKYKHKYLIEASNILVKTKEEAYEIIKELQITSDFNLTFLKIAKEKSIGKASRNGGYLGFFEKKNMVKDFQKALDELEVNSYTKKPIKTQYGYHIIYLHSVAPEGYFSFKKVKRAITLYIIDKKINSWIDTKIKTLKKHSKIIYFYQI